MQGPPLSVRICALTCIKRDTTQFVAALAAAAQMIGVIQCTIAHKKLNLPPEYKPW